MARLILKYNLSDLYVASESRPALRDYFPKVLGELAAQGGQEVIFIDGLDQLEEDATGVRDLSFLPNNPPHGVVFVLGTRPNDTLRPLELLKPHYEYQLPNLSREDFEAVLQHRQVQLERGLADQFYTAMQGNALYLDLLAKELAERGTTTPEVLIRQIADNPEHVFSLAMARLKRQPGEWREVIKPVLGVLLTEQEPLGLRHIRQILGVDEDRLREGIERLGGLVVRDWHSATRSSTGSCMSTCARMNSVLTKSIFLQRMRKKGGIKEWQSGVSRGTWQSSGRMPSMIRSSKGGGSMAAGTT